MKGVKREKNYLPHPLGVGCDDGAGGEDLVCVYAVPSLGPAHGDVAFDVDAAGGVGVGVGVGLCDEG